MNKEIKELITNIEEESIIFGGISENKINEIEKILNIKLSLSYREFLNNYGGGIFAGVEVYGANPNIDIEESSCIKNTCYFRENEDMPLNLLVIEVVGEYVYCLKSVKEDDESEVYVWDSLSKKEKTSEYSNFNEYLYKRINEVI